ncbi:BnaA04g17000D [Brassica napus]|uniref:Zinc knuckle CX2CX4HX4C domain-containing protein n=2 Tax=Brassica TaxID=3705 RepID=A0A3P6CHX7_BRACM|nr:unnamed protein product [Brassica napus]CDY31764.1 BnaA04g17000D [Brassica napus]VDD14070.1 unnamed protein product [Brassica rapa]
MFDSKIIGCRIDNHCSTCFRLDHSLKDCLEEKARKRALSGLQEKDSSKLVSVSSVKETSHLVGRVPRDNASFHFSASQRADQFERRPARSFNASQSRRENRLQPRVWQEKEAHRRSSQARERSHYPAARYNGSQRDRTSHHSRLDSQGRSFYREVANPQTPVDTNESSSTRAHPGILEKGIPLQEKLPSLPKEALQLAREEVRDAMLQYTKTADPTEREARTERMRQAEEQGDIEKTAAHMVQASLNESAERMITEPSSPTPERVSALRRLALPEQQDRIPAPLRLGPSPPGPIIAGVEGSPTANRIPATLRLGSPPALQNSGDLNATKAISKRKPGRPPGRKTVTEKTLATSKPLVASGNRVRKVAGAKPSPHQIKRQTGLSSFNVVYGSGASHLKFLPINIPTSSYRCFNVIFDYQLFFRTIAMGTKVKLLFGGLNDELSTTTHDSVAPLFRVRLVSLSSPLYMARSPSLQTTTLAPQAVVTNFTSRLERFSTFSGKLLESSPRLPQVPVLCYASSNCTALFWVCSLTPMASDSPSLLQGVSMEGQPTPLPPAIQAFSETWFNCSQNPMVGFFKVNFDVGAFLRMQALGLQVKLLFRYLLSLATSIFHLVLVIFVYQLTVEDHSGCNGFGPLGF